MMDTLAGVLTVVLIGGLVCSGVGILVAVSVNVSAEVMIEVKFAMPASLDGFSC